MPSLAHDQPASALLIGRVNVGKSTLFNRILHRYQALTSTEPGTTRDINRALVNWRGKTFWLVDSGGFNPKAKEAVDKASQAQLQRAIQEATVVMLIVDGQTGLVAEDRLMAKQLCRLKAPRLLVINKVDNPTKRIQAAKISLGWPDTIMVSAQTGSGVGDLLDLVVQHLGSIVEPKANIAVALLGQTNTGKSSLYNALLKAERSLVLPTPHTTRDRLHDWLRAEDLIFEIIDTAGIRRQQGRAPTLEKLSVKQSLKALETINVALLLIDSSHPPSWQDQHLGKQIVAAGTGALILLTKSDLVPLVSRPEIENKLRRWLPMLSWAPIIWLSAKSGEGLAKLLPLIKQADQSWRRQLADNELKSFWIHLKKSATTNRLPLLNFEQTNTRPPSFKLTLKQKTSPPQAIGDWVGRQLRKKFDFQGSPITIRLRGSRSNT